MKNITTPCITQLSPLVFLYEGKIRPPEIPNHALALPHVPDEAFGDGRHPTTRLCAGALDFICRLHSPESLLDVGTGTGVLTRIARARGVNFIHGTDIDPIALKSANMHAALDSYKTQISFTPFEPDHWGARFELVIANILELPLKALAPQLSGALRPGGTLLISGFTAAQIPFLKNALTNQDLEFISESFLGEWALLRFKKNI